MYGCDNLQGDNSKSLSLIEKTVRGTISNYKAKKNPEVANLQRVDACYLGENINFLQVKFSLKIVGGIGPSSCNKLEWKDQFAISRDKYIEEYGFKELALRYAINIANARWLWRNRVEAKNIIVKVEMDNGTEVVFNAFDYSLKSFDYSNDEKINKVAEEIEKALCAEDSVTIFNVSAIAEMGTAEEVYPSEEMIMDKDNSLKNKKSKVLYAVNGVAALHSQKISNAIRTVDDWYPDYKASIGAIAAEPYGAVTNIAKVFRTEKDKCDFYTLVDKFINDYDSLIADELHYVMSVIVRGGVFGGKD